MILRFTFYAKPGMGALVNQAPARTELGTRPVATRAPFSRRRVGFTPTEPEGNTPLRPELSVIVPLRNEAANVLPLVQQVFKALSEPPRRLELILVDDASTDNTWDQLLEAQRHDGRVRPLRHLRHSGQSAALWTGFETCRADVIATLDGDLQNDPADLPRLLAELASCDLVCGVRARRMDSLVRRISSAIASGARKLALGTNFRDIGCNLRAFKRPVLQTLLPFNGLHRFMPVLAQDAGAVVRELPINHRPRVAGRSKYGVWNRLGRGILDLSMIAWYRKRQLPTVPVVEHAVQGTGQS